MVHVKQADNGFSHCYGRMFGILVSRKTSKFVYRHFYLLKSRNIHCYGHYYLYIQYITDMRRLTTAIRSEKCVVSRLRRRANVIECKR